MRVWLFAVFLGPVLIACASGEEVPVRPDRATTSYDAGPFQGVLDSVSITGPCAQCDDQNPCTKDLCLAGGGCATEPEAKGVSCDDGDACTGNDRCDGAGGCQGDPATDIVYRYHHLGTDAYYYSRSSDGGPKGYGFEKKLFRIRRQSDPQTQPLYRLLSAKYAEFMLSLDQNEAADCCGYTENGVVGGIYVKQQPGTVPLYRLKRKLPVLRHISSLSNSERADEGFALEYIQGYVCPL